MKSVKDIERKNELQVKDSKKRVLNQFCDLYGSRARSGRREIISLHIGQAGIQTGNSYWTQLCEEHNIGMDGRQIGSQPDDNCYLNVFNEDRRNTYRPRSVFIDLDDTFINRSKKQFKDLHSPDNFVVGQTEDARDSFAEGYHL